MKCRKCGQKSSGGQITPGGHKAVINMRHHKLALCAEHYLEWLPAQVEHAIRKYRMFTRQERLLVAVSGGKDSLSLWDILWRLGFNADGLYIGLGIDEGIAYSAELERLTRQFAKERGLSLHVVNFPEVYGESIPGLAGRSLRGQEKPCSVCGIAKRHVMNRIAHERAYDVLVTGHNLDDEAAVLLGNTLNWIPGYLLRQAPVLDASRPGLVRKAKPLCRVYEREMAAYALLRGIEYVYDECPFAAGSNTNYYKELLNKLELDRPSAKLNFYLAFLQARENGLFAPQADTNAENLHTCPRCGQATTTPDECTFCRMLR